jgi:DNA-3-methyladenine glycosylase II
MIASTQNRETDMHHLNGSEDAVILHPQAPYDFDLTINAARFYSVRGRRLEGAYRRVLRLSVGLALVELRSAGTTSDPVLEARVLAANHRVDASVLEERLIALLNLRYDLQPFYGFAQSDPVLLTAVERLRGLRTVVTDTLFEAVITSIIEQQITLRMAHAAERWLMAWAGECIEFEGESYYAFPTPERLALATIDDLKPLKITGQRIARIIEIARGVTNGTLDLEGLRGQPPEDVYTVLRNIKGVGHWTAAWTMIKGLGHFANFGSGDVGLRAAANAYYFGLPGNADRATVDALLARYSPYDGIAAYFTLMRWAMEKYTYIA